MRQRTSPENWKLPLKWNREVERQIDTMEHYMVAGGAGAAPIQPRRQRVFCASLADWLDDEVPIEWLADLLNLIRLTPNLDWQLLTKRPEHWRKRLEAVAGYAGKRGESGESSWSDTWGFVFDWIKKTPPDNVWLGTTVEDQARAEERIPELVIIPAMIRFLSCEPLLEPINLSARTDRMEMVADIDWVICGGESGPGARPMNPEWALNLREQCQASSVAFFMKQLGGTRDKREELSDFPVELQVREFPVLERSGVA